MAKRYPFGVGTNGFALIVFATVLGWLFFTR